MSVITNRLKFQRDLINCDIYVEYIKLLNFNNINAFLVLRGGARSQLAGQKPGPGPFDKSAAHVAAQLFKQHNC